MQQALFQTYEPAPRLAPSLYCGEVGKSYASATFPLPRPFQVTAHESLRQGVKDGHLRQILMSATGSGKTYLALQVAQESLKKGRRVLFIADRTVLIDQTSRVADQYGMFEHGIIQADHWRTDYSKNFQIGSAQTIARRNLPMFDVVIIDECHCQYKAWKELMESQPEAHFIGLSATPFSRGLGLLFTNLVNAATMHELTESGVLVPMKIMSCHKVDMTGAETRGGEWTDRAASERALKIKGDVVTDWLQHGYPRKTVVFGPTIADCEAFRDQFIEQGIKAAVFCADTTVAEREEHLKSFREPDGIMVLLSVEALAKGFDAPEVSCICDVRPLRKSLSTAIQMWGRGLRSCEGKTECLILDFSGNIVRFADDFSDIFYNGLDKLDSGEKLDKTIRRDDEEEKKDPKCPKCGFTPCGKTCIQCGHVRKKLATAEAEAGEMKEIFIGKSRLADDKRHLYEQLCSYTREMNFKEGYAYKVFKNLVGVPPQWDFHSMPDVPVTRATKNKLTQLRLAWIKAKEKRERG